jgi:5,10-methylene-tetrahydrofolate dehydrogenase/methenyl tetrahydrofolate cyclohydrolase
MLVDGNAIAADIQASLKNHLEGRSLTLVVVQVGSDAASSKFIEKKREFGEKIGIEVKLQLFRDSVTEEELAGEIRTLAADEAVHGIVVQLPLPAHINTKAILNLVPSEKDPDALSERPCVLPPVAAAVAEILQRYRVDVVGKRAIIVGRGRLVGVPVAQWLDGAGAEVETFGRDDNITMYTKTADIIIAGTGVPGLLKPDMIKDGVVLIDAGTSEAAGKLVGDIDPACAEKAYLYTPVPGGVGPVTVAKLFENLVTLGEASL